MLKNPAYKGEAAFGKTRWMPVGPRLRAPRGKPVQSRRGYAGNDAPTEEWITIPVPALVDPALFELYKSNWKKTDDEHVSPRKVLGTYCRACSSVPNAGMLIMVAQMMCAMRIIVVQEHEYSTTGLRARVLEQRTAYGSDGYSGLARSLSAP